MQTENSAPRVAIACGGTGGHLFPGVAVAKELVRRGCEVTLLISPKEVDQTAVKTATGMKVATLPAIGLTRGKMLAFIRGFHLSYRSAARLFKLQSPDAVLAMGGFTSAPPILAAKARGIPTFLHESNIIPGRANRWLSWVVTWVFTGFPEAATRLHTRNFSVTGTPVRPEFAPADVAACRRALGLDPARPVLLVTGGSQGATGLNNVLIAKLPELAKNNPELQVFHLAGPNDVERLREAYRANRMDAVVHSFFADMPVALSAASVAISRAGASSLAELAAMRVPSILIPLPASADDHQRHNAISFMSSGGCRVVFQAAPDRLPGFVLLLLDEGNRQSMGEALAKLHRPKAAGEIAESIMQTIAARRRVAGKADVSPASHLQNRQTAIT